VTSTYTASPTPTFTATPTPTRTSTPTFTDSPTATYTASPTSTFTASPTPTFTFTASPLNTLTDTPTVTDTYTFTASPTRTFTASPTQTYTDSPTRTFTASPTQTFTASPTRTFSASPTSTFTESPTASFTASPTQTFTDSPTKTVTPTYTATLPPQPYQISVAIYNSAGEKVKDVYSGTAAYDLTHLKVAVAGPQSSGAPVLVDLGGLGAPSGDLVWNGSNQGGQWVSNGVYYVKVTSTDPFGNVTTTTESVNVIGVENQESVEIFNSAGEVVRKFDLSGVTSTVQNMALNLPAGQSAVAASTNPVTGAVTGGVNLTLNLGNGGTQPLFWDGMGSGGAPLQSGTYLVELVRTQPGQTSTIKTVAVTLLEAKNNSAQAVAASAKVGPNPVLKGGDVIVHYKPNAQNWVVAKLYNESGEMVAQAADFGSGALNFGKGFSGGIYMLDFEVRSGDLVVCRRILKAAVVH
jgi:hypothetical protein